MKMKEIKDLTKDFKSANTWACDETLGELIKFLKTKNKIRKCGMPDAGGYQKILL